MDYEKELGKQDGERGAEGEVRDAELDQVLKSFRLSVHAWSEAEFIRPRTAAMTIGHRSWRLATVWALGCALFAGAFTAALYDRHQREEARIAAAQRDAERQRQLAAQKIRQEEDELAKVDSDVSRDAPAAMEPLAQLMGEDESQ
jgi:hypothetical protein